VYTAADFAVVIVAVVVVALAKVSAVSELWLLLTDRITDASATLAPALTTADGTRVVSGKRQTVIFGCTKLCVKKLNLRDVRPSVS